MNRASRAGSVLCLATLASISGASPPTTTIEPASRPIAEHPRWIADEVGQTSTIAKPPITPERMDCGDLTLTQSTDMTVITNTVFCGSTTTSAETSLARAIVAPSDMTLKCVTFGVRNNVGNDWPVEVRILAGSIGSDYASLILLSQTEVVIPSGATSQLYTAQLPPTMLLAGAEYVIELRTPTRTPTAGGDGGRLELGCNNRGQSAPTYFRGPTCGVTNFQTAASVGFANRHLLMSLGYDEPSGPPNDSPYDAPLIDLGTPVAFSTLDALADGPPGSCVSGGDIWFMVQAGTDPILSVDVYTRNDADAAIACYDIGPSGTFDIEDLCDLIVDCSDEDTPGLDSAAFDVTPGHFYLIQVGNGGGGSDALNGMMMAYAGLLTPYVQACIPGPCDSEGKASVCKLVDFGYYFNLTGAGARLADQFCSECDPPTLPCPCLSDTRNLAAYWPMTSITSGWPSYTVEDWIGAADLDVPNVPGNYVTMIDGPKGKAFAITASTVSQGSRGGLIPSTLNPIPHHGASTFTFAAWVQVPAAGGIIYSNGWKISVDTNGAVRFDGVVQCTGLPPVAVSVSSDEVTVPASPILTLTPGQWAHVVVKVARPAPTDSSVTFWINGTRKHLPQSPSWPCAAIGGPEPAELGDDGMWLDEVMLFDRAISDTRAGALMGASLVGLCEYTGYVTPYIGCIGTASIDVTICDINQAGFGVFYELGKSGFAGDPSRYYGEWTPCTSNRFELSPYILVANPGSCVTQTYSIGTPPACATGFTFSVLGSGAGPTSLSGTVRCEFLSFTGGFSGPISLFTSAPQFHTLSVENLSPSPVSYPYQLAVMDSSGMLDTSMFSLNELDAGAILTGTINLAPGATMEIPILIEALSVDALGFYNLTLSVDETGSGTYLPVGAIGLRALLPPGITLCPSDYTGDTTVDILDFLDFFQDFGTCLGQPSPCGTFGNVDMNGDTIVDILDFLDFLNAFGNGC